MEHCSMDLFLEPDKPLLPFVIPTGSQLQLSLGCGDAGFHYQNPQGELNLCAVILE